MFYNVKSDKIYDSDEMNPKHNYFSEGLDATWVCLGFLGIMILANFGQIKIFSKCFGKHKSNIDDDVFDE